MKIGSLCTGYGGLDMAVEAHFNAETVWVSEIDKYASLVIEKRISKPNLGDLKMVNWQNVEPIDILTAGYPCQPFSHAGFRKGDQDERHIWPHIKTIIGTLRPKIIVLENVRGHLTLGFREVLGDLTEIGYDVKWTLVRASDVGAPHRRERLFIVAKIQHSDPNRERLALGENGGKKRNQRKSQSIIGDMGEDAPDASCTGLQRTWHKTNDTPDGTTFDASHKFITHNGKMQKLGRRFAARREMHMQDLPNALDQDGKLNVKFIEYMMGLPNGWVTDVPISRSQQIKILGNGVVPQQALYALELLSNE